MPMTDSVVVVVPSDCERHWREGEAEGHGQNVLLADDPETRK